MQADLEHLLKGLVDGYSYLEFFGMPLGRSFDNVLHLRAIERTETGFLLDYSEGSTFLKIEIIEPERFVMKKKAGGARERTIDIYAQKVVIDWVLVPRERWSASEKNNWTMEKVEKGGDTVTVESSLFTVEDGKRVDKTMETQAPAVKVFTYSA